jgi:hypothetical protein
MGFPGVQGSYLQTSQAVPFGDQFTLFAFVATNESAVPLLSNIDYANGMSLALSGGKITFQAGQVRGVQSNVYDFQFTRYTSVAVTVDRAAQSIKMYYNGSDAPVVGAYGSGNPADTFAFQPGGTMWVGSFWGIYEGGSKYMDQVQVYNSALKPDQIAQLNLTGSLNVKPAAPTPVSLPAAKLQYGFEGSVSNAGTTGSANDGTLSGSATIAVGGTGTAAVGQGALKLATDSSGLGRFGVGSYALSDTSDQGGDATISAWVKAGDSATLQMIFANANTFPYGGFKLFLDSSKALHLEIGNGSGGVAGFGTDAGALLNDGKFHQVTVTIRKSGDEYGNTYGRIFVDGTDLTTVNAPIGSVSGPADTSFGQQDSTSEPFPLVGSLDDLRTYAGRLSSDQIWYISAPRWAEDVGGSFGNSANWNGKVPGGEGSIARLGDRVLESRTVTLDGDRTLGGLIVDPAIGGTYTLSGPGKLTVERYQGALVQNLSGANVVSADVVLKSSTTFDVAGGSSLTLAGAVTGDSDNNLTKTGAGVLVIKPVTANSLTVSGGTWRAAHSSVLNTATVVGSVSVAGGALLDLGNTDLIVRNGDVNALRGLVTSWYAGGARNGSGIGAESNAYTTLAVFGNDAGGGAAYFASYDGVTLGASDVIVKYTLIGDVNLDGTVDGKDYRRVMEGAIFGLSGWANGDLNYDGVVDSADLGLINATLAAISGGGSGLPPPVGSGAGTGSGTGSIPEPGHAALVPLAGMLVAGRRRR